MTVSTLTTTNAAVEGNDSTTEFTFTWACLETSHVEVIHTDASGTETTLTEDTHYSVVLTDPGGTVTYPLTGSPLTTGEYLTVSRSTPMTQTLDLVEQGPWSPENNEDAYDKLTCIVQELNYDVNLAVDSAAASAEAAADSAEDAADSAEDAANSAAEVADYGYVGQWAASTAYVTNNIVYVTVAESATNGGSSYIALSDHTSGAGFDADLTAGKWTLHARRGASGAGTGDMTVAMYDPAGIEEQLVGLTTAQTLTNKTLTAPTVTSPVINTGVSGTAVLDDDTMATATDTTLATSESIKAYVDAQIGASTQGQHTIWVPAGAVTATSTNGAAAATEELATNDVMVLGFDFDATAQESVQFQIQMPKSWNEGTLVCQFLWKDATTAGTGNVIWGIQARAFGDSDALDAAFGTAQEVTDAFITSGDLHVSSEAGAMTAAGTPAAEDMVIFRVYRDAADASDTYSQDARLLGVKIHYTTNAENDD